MKGLILYILPLLPFCYGLVGATASSLTSCLTQAHVPYLVSSSAGYANETDAFNVRVQYKPAAIAVPTTTAQVSSALLCAAASNISVQAKGGGHSYAGFSLGGKDGTLSISLEKFSDVTLGPTGYASDIAKVGGGQRLGNVATALYSQGKVGLPHGSCPGVGMGGHATHGGFGFNGRAWGLALDAIIAMEAVLPNGTVATVTAESSPDLWFALRGAADSFGIVTNFYMQTHPVPTTMVYFSYAFGNIWSSKDARIPTRMLLHLQDFGNNASVLDGRTTFDSYLDGESWSTSGQFQGSLSEFNSKIGPELLRTMPKPASASVRVVNWTESLTILAGNDPLAEPLGGAYTLHGDFYAKSLTVPSSNLITEAGAAAFFTYILQHGVHPSTSGWYWYTIFDLWGGPGSAINKHASADSAFSQRDNFWTLQNYGYATGGTFPKTFPAGIKPFIQGLNDALPNAQAGGTFGAYSNYVDDALSPSQAHAAYYGNATYQRLLGIKRLVDPGNVISNPLAVGM